jgi:hypothetical protein
MTRCPSELDLERHLLAADPVVEAHLAECPRCAERLAEMRREGETFRRVVFPATVDAVVEHSRPATARARRWVVALAPLSAAAAAALFLLGRPPHDYVGTKGGDLVLTVFVDAPGGARAATDGASVPAGSAVRFQVRAKGPCRLWVVSVDATGQVSRLFPASGEAQGEVAPEGPLPGGAILDDRPGPERFFAVCSARPLPLADVERAARMAAPGGDAAVRGAKGLPGLPEGVTQATLLLEKRP